MLELQRTDALVVRCDGSQADPEAMDSARMIRHLEAPVADAPCEVVHVPAAVRVVLRGGADDIEVLRGAAREARLRGGVALWVIRAVPGAGSDVAVRQAMDSAWHTIDSVPQCASLRCRVELVTDDTAELALGRCRSDDLLVVGARGPGAPPCDVMVVRVGPPRGRLKSNDRVAVLEQQSGVQR